jgi:hypothetical protein
MDLFVLHLFKLIAFEEPTAIVPGISFRIPIIRCLAGYAIYLSNLCCFCAVTSTGRPIQKKNTFLWLDLSRFISLECKYHLVGLSCFVAWRHICDHRKPTAYDDSFYGIL